LSHSDICLTDIYVCVGAGENEVEMLVISALD
jgi:hypothetical protein